MKKIIVTLLFLSAFLASPITASADETSGGMPLLRKMNEAISSVLFFDVAFGNLQVTEVTKENVPVKDETGQQKYKTVEVPFLVVILALGAVFFTFFHGFVNFYGFKHAINIVRGKYDKEEDHGEISHFRALTSALSATVGLGNIAGVAVAIQVGGPGAVLWMMVLAFFGMSAKFNSCTLSQLYRKVNDDGSISGGPMYYLDIGLREKGGIFAPIGKVLGILFAIMIMGGSVGGGNMFQANQTVEAFQHAFGFSEGSKWVIGIIMCFLIALVILGGIKRIGAATSKIVPFMCGLYVLASLVVILSNASAIPASLLLIFEMAFQNNAFYGGILGVMVKGVTRAGFSNEAGLGSAAIAHAAAKTSEPVREGLVAMLGPFIDTIVICLMTSLVIIVTGTWTDPELTSSAGNVGVTLTSESFATVLPWFPYVLTICIALFAYSTAISWYYYGERGWIYLLDHVGEGTGLKTVVVFRSAFILFTLIGAVSKLSDVLDFSDLMILSIAFPNILGSVILAPRVKEKLKDYFKRYREGAFDA